MEIISIDIKNSMTCLTRHGISAGQSAVSGGFDEVHVVVVDEDGDISGSPHSVLETHGFLSLASDLKDASGRSNYYKNVIARDSQWVWWSTTQM